MIKKIYIQNSIEQETEYIFSRGFYSLREILYTKDYFIVFILSRVITTIDVVYPYFRYSQKLISGIDEKNGSGVEHFNFKSLVIKKILLKTNVDSSENFF